VYGRIVGRLMAAIVLDTSANEAREIPDIDRERPCAKADISVFTTSNIVAYLDAVSLASRRAEIEI
jgi:hypothetical protein